MVHANLIVRVTRIVSRIPVLVCTAHAHAEGNWLTDIAYGITDGLADRTTHVSRVGLERYLKVRAISRKRALWIPNGIDIERFGGSSERRTSIRKALGVEEGEFLWLAVAAFRPEKAHDNLVRAFARLPTAARLVVVGEGPLRSSVMRLASGLSLGDRIAYLGGRDDVAAIMSAADAFVLCSRWEALPLVLLEAAASRLPIVTTDVGGCSEIVEHNLNGYLTPPDDPHSLAEAMRLLMMLPKDELARMGAAGRRMAEETYDIRNILRDMGTPLLRAGIANLVRLKGRKLVGQAVPDSLGGVVASMRMHRRALARIRAALAGLSRPDPAVLTSDHGGRRSVATRYRRVVVGRPLSVRPLLRIPQY